MALIKLTGETLGGGALIVTIPAVSGKVIYPISIFGVSDGAYDFTFVSDGNELLKGFFPAPGGFIDKDFTGKPLKDNPYVGIIGKSWIFTITASVAKANITIDYEVL